MYYPIGWPKKLNFQYRDISVVVDSEHTTDRLPHSGASNGHDSCDSNQVNGHASASNGHASDLEADEQKEPLDEKRLLQIAANSDRTLFAVLTPRSLHVWFSRPSVEIVCHWRSNKSIDQLGHNFAVHWKPDSTAIVIKVTTISLSCQTCGLPEFSFHLQTTRDVLIFYQVAFKDDFEAVFEQTDSM